MSWCPPGATNTVNLPSIAASPLPGARQLRCQLDWRSRSLGRVTARAGAARLCSVTEHTSSAPDLAGCLVAVGAEWDRDAFAILFSHFAPRLKSYFGSAAGHLSTADDLVQETMFRVWTKAGQYDPAKGPASAWVFTIARNLRSNGNRGRHLMEVGYDLEAIEDPSPKMEGVVSAYEAEARLQQVLGSLSQDQADLLQASFFDDKSHMQIAQERNMPLGTVKSQLRRTLIRLRAALSDMA